MIKAMVEKFKQFIGIAAILGLALAPFASSLGTARQQPEAHPDHLASSAPSMAPEFPADPWLPSISELETTLNKVQQARKDVLRAAAVQPDPDASSDVYRYQQAIREWKAMLNKVFERETPEGAHNLRYELFSMARSDDSNLVLRPYAWEFEGTRADIQAELQR
jgi:hypothetical protein